MKAKIPSECLGNLTSDLDWRTLRKTEGKKRGGAHTVNSALLHSLTEWRERILDFKKCLNAFIVRRKVRDFDMREV